MQNLSEKIFLIPIRKHILTCNTCTKPGDNNSRSKMVEVKVLAQ